MKASFLRPLPGYLLIKHSPEQAITESGLTHSENEDDFAIHGTVVQSSKNSQFHPGDEVVFHVLEASVGFFDENTKYSFVEEKIILAFYDRANK